MPFNLVRVEGGWKVRDDKGKLYSDEPLSRRAALAQQRALYVNVPDASKFGDNAKEAVSGNADGINATGPKGLGAGRACGKRWGSRRRKSYMSELDIERHNEEDPEEHKHLQGKHDQKRHGARWGIDGVRKLAKGMGLRVRQTKDGKIAITGKTGGGFGTDIRANNITSAKKFIRDIKRRENLKRREGDAHKKGEFTKGDLVEMPINKFAKFRGTVVRRARQQGVDGYIVRNIRPDKSGGRREMFLPKKDTILVASRSRTEGMSEDTLAFLKSKNSHESSSLTVFKDSTGEYRWVLFSSNAYRDLDREIVSTKALEEDVARTDETKEYGPLRWWHVDGFDIGDCDWRVVHGHTLIESGTFRSKALGERTMKNAKKLQVSIGFKHPPDQPDGEGVYDKIRTFERSLLPRGKAANPFTRVFVSQEDDMATKAEKLAEFEKKYGMKPDQFLAAAEEAEKELEGLNITHKEGDGGEVDPVEAEKAKKPKPEPEDDEEEEGEEEPVIGNMSVKEFESFLGKALAPITEKMHSHDAAKESGEAAQAAAQAVKAEKESREAQIKTLQDQIAALQNQVKELGGEIPRAFAGGYRASEDPNTVVDPGVAKEAGPQADNFLANFIGNLVK